MSNPLLSILIPTVVGREEKFNSLVLKIAQVASLFHYEKFLEGDYPSGGFCKGRYNGEEAELVYYKDNKDITIGEKRELLYKMSNGLYSLMIDDDDDVSDNAIQLIFEAIKSNPEIPCITFREKCIMNGVYKSSNHSIKYDKWQDNFDGYDYVRCPFYKDVIKTDIAQSVPFPHIRYNEDEQWSMAIKPLLTDEIHIDEELYHYIYNTTETHEERYGINR